MQLPTVIFDEIDTGVSGTHRRRHGRDHRLALGVVAGGGHHPPAAGGVERRTAHFVVYKRGGRTDITRLGGRGARDRDRQDALRQRQSPTPPWPRPASCWANSRTRNYPPAHETELLAGRAFRPPYINPEIYTHMNDILRRLRPPTSSAPARLSATPGSKPHGAPSAPNPTWSARSARDC